MVGVTLNSYTIIKKISEGGMGEIYLAEHKFLERKAAVKVLHKTYSSNKDIRQRFIQEAQTLSRLDHPHIVKIFDFDQYQDVFYIIMEFISGYTLEEYTSIKNGLMPEHIAKEFFTKVLSAVNYAHDNNVIHRDIKPSNIMIDVYNDPKILDFGIARLINADQRVTKVNTKMGSILYMSPEQVLGKEVDFKSDIYSLGITLYETLTAKHPYDIEEDSDYTLQSKIINNYPPPPSAYYPMITKQMEYVISTAINKDPDERFVSCQNFSEAINDPYYTSEYLFSNEKLILPLKQSLKSKKESVNINSYTESYNSDYGIGRNEEPEKIEKIMLNKDKDSNTNISDFDAINNISEYPDKSNESQHIHFPALQDNLKNAYKGNKIFYTSPIFYFSILLIVFIGFLLFFYFNNDSVSDKNNIIKVDTTKALIKTPPPPPAIQNSDENVDKIQKDTKGKNTTNKSNKSKIRGNNDYEGTNNPSSKKTRTTFE